MENVDRNIAIVRRKLEKANAEVIRLSSCIADANHEKEKSDKMTNDKIARLMANIKVLEGQYDSVVSSKFKATKKLSEVEPQLKNYQRELQQLKEQNTKQQIRINVLEREISAFGDEKKKIQANFDSFKSQEKVIGALKSKFEEEIVKFLKRDAFRTDTCCNLVENRNEKVPPSSTVASTKSAYGANQVAGVTNNGTELSNIKEFESHLMRNVAVRGDCHPEVQSRTHASSYNHVKMRKTSGTTVKGSTSTTNIEMTKTKSVKTQKLIKRKCSTEVVTRRKTDVELSDNQIVERPKRFMKCTFCLKSYISTPEKAFCGCQYMELAERMQ